MLLVAITWLYIVLTALPLGIAASKMFGIRPRQFVETAFIGLFATTVLASVWAFFGRVNIEFQLFHLIVCALAFKRNRADFAQILQRSKQIVSDFSAPLKLIFWATLLIILGQSAAAPFVLDNESYYIQTVKWLNEYGFVKGIANLHVLLGQFSGWHIAQSALDFSFLYDKFNDLSGLCLLLGNVYAFFRLDAFFKTGNKIALIAGLLPLVNVFLLRFSGAPSPDIPVYVLTVIVADRFVSKFAAIGASDFNLIWILVLFVLYCKTSSVMLLLLPLFLVFFHRPKLLQPKIIASAIVIFGLFVAKNTVVSGYPFHPLPEFALGTDYALPKNIADLYYIETKIYGFEMAQADYNAANWMQLLVRWITLGQLHGFFNILTVSLLVVVPFCISRSESRKPLWLLYAAMVLQLVLFLLGSPQYRYYINFTLFFSLFCLTVFRIPKKFIVLGIGVSSAASLVLLVFPFRLDALSRNENTRQTSAFAVENVIFPYQNSRLGVSYQTAQKGNLKFWTPIDSPFFWATGDGQLPCVNKEQLDYIEKYYGVCPQLRTDDLKEGFYSRR